MLPHHLHQLHVQGISGNGTSSTHSWLVTSGATDHMTNKPDLFSTFTSFKTPLMVRLANGSKVPAIGKGTIAIHSHLLLYNALLVPSFPMSLLSVKQLCLKNHCQVIFTADGCIFQDMKNRMKIGHGSCDGSLYYLQLDLPLASQVSSCLESSQALKWHFRVGHPHLNKLKLMVPCLSNVSHIRCETCELSKHRSASLPSSSKLSLIKHLISFILMYGVP